MENLEKIFSKMVVVMRNENFFSSFIHKSEKKDKVWMSVHGVRADVSAADDFTENQSKLFETFPTSLELDVWPNYIFLLAIRRHRYDMLCCV